MIKARRAFFTRANAHARAAATISRSPTFARDPSNLERRPRDSARVLPLGAIAPIPGESP